MTDYRFGPAVPGEETAFGASAPRSDPDEWVAYVEERGIERVCCLLSDTQLARREGLLATYRAAFGSDRVTHVPIQDGHLPTPPTLDLAVEFLEHADRASEPAVVHCLAGMGRTGVVLAAWLVAARGYDPAAAVEAVSDAGRTPTEAVRLGNATRDDLLDLLAIEQ